MEDPALTETRGPLLYRLGIVMSILPTLAIILRFWARSITNSKIKFWWDDWLALLAWACCIVNCAFTIRGVQLGLGKRFKSYASKDDQTELLKLIYFSSFVFNLGITFAKFSVLLFYNRVFSARSRNFKIAHGITCAFVAAYIIFKVPVERVSCNPPRKFWRPEIEGHCESDYTNLGLLLSGLLLDVITDLMILLLPMRIIVRLQVNRKKMLALLAAFITGYITWITSLGRMGSYIATRNHLGDPDLSWYQLPDLAWSLAEISVSVLSICIPSCFYLFQRISLGGFTSLFSTRDISATPRKDRGAPSGQGALGYQISGANESYTQSAWRDDSGSNSEASHIRLVDVNNTRKVGINPTAVTEVPAEPSKIYVTNDVILSYKSSEDKRASSPYRVVYVIA